MGLTSQLLPPLFCLLACASNFVHGGKCDITLNEIIKTLNILTERKSTTEKETFCRAATVLRQFYSHPEKRSLCRGAHGHHKPLTKFLKGLDRNLYSMANLSYCPVNEARKSTLEDFLKRLKMIMKEKYSKC
ncbi:interleukin-4 isoform X2 [Carlito syrichta]|uniref:Interleukin-4 n=1 Tax=Carlito syrichta TaxID=1868482 RepID=A0A3Q0DXX0_CARSF|nr:interleukin-4 isoform X2 [Carlito syrichta]